MAVDPTFGVDSYNRTKVLNESQTVAYNVLTLLLGKPGFYPSIPSLGMDITKYLYRFEDEIDVDTIKDELVSQCKDFSVQVANDDFTVIKTTYGDNQPLLVFIIPAIIANKENQLVLGVTYSNENQQIKFNFSFNKTQYI